MQVAQRLQLNVALSAMAALAVLLALFLAAYRVNQAVEVSVIADGIIAGSLERVTLRNDYVQSGSERARVQLFSKHEQIGRLLNSAAERIGNPADKKKIDGMIEDHESIGRILSSIVKNREKEKNPAQAGELLMETEERLLSQLNMKNYGLVLYARGLQNSSREALFSALLTAGWWIGCVLVLGMAVVIINSWTMSRSTTKRIRLLRDGAAMIGGGRLDYRIEIQGADELADLSEAFNAMSAKLRDSYRDLESEVGERRRAEQTLTDQAAKLVEINKELESFSYSVSHDLRAPLRAINGFSQMLLRDLGGKLDAESSRKLGIIRENTRQMGQLIDDLLAFSRLGRAAMSLAAFDMEGLIDEVWEELRKANPERDMQLRKGVLPEALGDRALIKQVLLNLLANAVKFTRLKVPAIIVIGGTRQGEENVYFVSDNGAGFDMKYHEKLFGVFQRLHSESEYEGTGVGLAIVQRIIHRHGGRVWAEGELNKGATFYFTLPRE